MFRKIIKPKKKKKKTKEQRPRVARERVTSIVLDLLLCRVARSVLQINTKVKPATLFAGNISNTDTSVTELQILKGAHKTLIFHNSHITLSEDNNRTVNKLNLIFRVHTVTTAVCQKIFEKAEDFRSV